MKKCPVCNANCFDDMEVCFGCMHHFGDDSQEPQRAAFPAPFIPVIEDIPEIIEEPPAHMEPAQETQIITSSKFAEPATEELEHQEEPLRGDHVRRDHTPVVPFPRTRRRGPRTGRKALHGNRALSGAAGVARARHEQKAAQTIVLPDGDALYRLVVSLQPVSDEIKGG